MTPHEAKEQTLMKICTESEKAVTLQSCFYTEI